MSLLSARRALVALPAFALFLSSVACDKMPFGDSGVTASSASPASTGSPGEEAEEPAGGDGAAKEGAPSAGGIQVTVKDFQIFHPYSSVRAMQSLRDDGTYDTTRPRNRYGVGVVIEAKNTTGEVLRDVSFEGTVRFAGEHGESRCRFVADRVHTGFSGDYGPRFLSYAPRPVTADKYPPSIGPQTDWKDESDGVDEAPWRPSERIRMSARDSDCDLPLLRDMDVKSVKVELSVKARKHFVESVDFEFSDKDFEIVLADHEVRIRDRASSKLSVVELKDVAEMEASGDATGPVVPLRRVKLGRFLRASNADEIESEEVAFDVSPDALTLQLVKLPEGDFAAASGNVVIRLKDNKVVFEEMAKLGLRLDTVERKDVPKAIPDLSFKADELSGKTTSIELVSAADDPSLKKGTRKVKATWKLHLEGGAIEGRLRADLDRTAKDLDVAERAAFTTDVGGDAAATAKAKADLAAAKAAKAAAEAKYTSSLSSERGRLAKLVTCGDVRLVTNSAMKTPTNAKEATAACKVLESADDVEVTMEYVLDRYELPVAIALSLGKDWSFQSVASAALLAFDAR